MKKTDIEIIGLAGVLPLVSLLAGATWAGENMIGQMSQNEGILVLPAPAAGVTIDGDLKDWDWSGRVWMFADAAVRDRYSTEVAAMWDKDNLYLAVKWKDPTPMFSIVDPAINPNDGWKSDAWQMRMETDHPMWLTTWYCTPGKLSALSIARWRDPNNDRGGMDNSLLVSKKGGSDLGQGVEMVYKADLDGKGFVQEIRLPWKLLFKTVPEIKPGLAIRLGCEFLWGDVTGGKAPPIHRFADNMAAGKTDRVFYWTTKAAWGEAKLVEKGNVPLRNYGDALKTARIEGTVPVRVSVPASARKFTIAIDDDQGNRVCNLAGDVDPKEYGVKAQGETREVEVKWDGLDDAGKPVNPGTYKVRGLSHAGLDAIYEMCFYNPGTPAWATGDGSGGWGADHTGPIAVTAAGDGMAIAFPHVEGGSGTIGLGADGLKKWGEKRGAILLAGTERHLFAVTRNLYVSVAQSLCRYGRADGSYQPFAVDGKDLPFELPLRDIMKGAGEATALAANETQVVVAGKQPDAESSASLELWVTGSPKGKPRGEWTLYVDDMRLFQSAGPDAVTSEELLGPKVQNGDFDAKGGPGVRAYLAKAVEITAADGTVPAASGLKFAGMVLDPKSEHDPRFIKGLPLPDLAKGRHFVMTAKVRAKEADGFLRSNLSVMFLDAQRSGVRQYSSKAFEVGPDAWTEVKLEFDFTEPEAVTSGQIAVLNAETAAPLKTFKTPILRGMAFGKDGTLYGIGENKVGGINLDTGAFTPIPMPGLEKPVALAIDHDGNLVVADGGADSQVKVSSPQGQPAYTCGKRGGRPIRGAFDKQAMTHMSSVAVDSKGLVWVVENWDYPRRVSVWGKDGKLVRDYIGNSGYMGMGCYLHDQDPTLAYCGPVEMKLDKANRTWNVTQVLWVPDPAAGESFEISPNTMANPQRFTSSASGKPHEYLFTHPDDGTRGLVVFMERKDGWKPVAAIGKTIHLSGRLSHRGKVEELPSGELAGVNPQQAMFWNDANSDGKVQRDECTFVDKPLPVQFGWGGRMASDMTIHVAGIVAYHPVGFDADGAPRYGLEGMRAVGVEDRAGGDLVPVPGEERLLNLSKKGYPGLSQLSGIDLKKGRIEWSYPNPFPGVHGSHKAIMPKPGMLIGPLKICGVAKINDAIGSVFLLRGNLGQDFLLTTDGLYVGSLFEDIRVPCEPLPLTEEAIAGKSLRWYSNKDEPFNGWFGGQADGKIRTMTGMAREGAMILEVTCLDTIRRFDGKAINLDAQTIAVAVADNAKRAAAAAGEAIKRYTVAKLSQPPALDGQPEAWKGSENLTVAREGFPDSASVNLAYDDNNLYARFVVKDASPWKNEGKDLGRLFKTGDAVDIQLSLDAKAGKHNDPIQGDLRIVIAPLAGKPAAVVMAPVSQGAAASAGRTYHTQAGGTRPFARIEVLTDAKVVVTVEPGGYTVVAAIPWTSLGGKPAAGTTLRGDVGFISSDVQGLRNSARTYWANKETNLTSDEPLESWLFPANWGELVFE